MLGFNATEYSCDQILTLFVALREKIFTHPDLLLMNTGISRDTNDTLILNIIERILKNESFLTTEYSLPSYLKTLQLLGNKESLQKVINEVAQNLDIDRKNTEHLKYLGFNEDAKRREGITSSKEANLKLLVEFKHQVQMQDFQPQTTLNTHPDNKKTYHPLNDHRRQRSYSEGEMPDMSSPGIFSKKKTKK